jgi:hypothetical protein
MSLRRSTVARMSYQTFVSINLINFFTRFSFNLYETSHCLDFCVYRYIVDILVSIQKNISISRYYRDATLLNMLKKIITMHNNNTTILLISGFFSSKKKKLTLTKLTNNKTHSYK